MVSENTNQVAFASLSSRTLKFYFYGFKTTDRKEVD